VTVQPLQAQIFSFAQPSIYGFVFAVGDHNTASSWKMEGSAKCELLKYIVYLSRLIPSIKMEGNSLIRIVLRTSRLHGSFR